MSFIWLHHPAAACEIYSDSDEETTNDFVIGSFCNTCKTNGTDYTILDAQGNRVKNPFVQHCKQFGECDTFKQPKVEHHVNCQDMMKLYSSLTTSMEAFIEPHLLRPQDSRIANTIMSFLIKPGATFFQFVANMVNFTT